MSIRILRGQDGRGVYRVETPSGVVGYIATEIPNEAVIKLVRKLTRQIRDGERRRARECLAAEADASGRWGVSPEG